MFYADEIVIPANTPALTPVVQRLGIHPGVTQEIFVGFPKGCYGLAHLQIWHHGWQIWPWTPRISFHWNDYMFRFNDRYPITSAPYEFVLKAWNLDDSYRHTLWFGVTLEPEPKVAGLKTLQRIMQQLGVIRE